MRRKGGRQGEGQTHVHVLQSGHTTNIDSKRRDWPRPPGFTLRYDKQQAGRRTGRQTRRAPSTSHEWSAGGHEANGDGASGAFHGAPSHRLSEGQSWRSFPARG